MGDQWFKLFEAVCRLDPRAQTIGIRIFDYLTNVPQGARSAAGILIPPLGSSVSPVYLGIRCT